MKKLEIHALGTEDKVPDEISDFCEKAIKEQEKEKEDFLKTIGLTEEELRIKFLRFIIEKANIEQLATSPIIDWVLIDRTFSKRALKLIWTTIKQGVT